MQIPANFQGKGLGESLNVRGSKRVDETTTESEPTPGDRNALAETRKRVGIAVVAAANRRSAASRANQVQNGQPLSALKATSGAPGGGQRSSSALVSPDGGRRSTSLFDLPSSGRGLVDRMRAQVRPSSPLNALSSGSDQNPGPPWPAPWATICWEPTTPWAACH